MELFHASRQWATRPQDERFQSVKQLYDVTRQYAVIAKEASAPWSDLRVEKVGDDVQLVGRTGVPAQLTHWAFGQLCSRVEAPASYLRELPATLAAQNLNHGLAKRGEGNNDSARLMFHSNGGLLLRAVTTDKYERFWNYEVAERLLELESRGWEPGHSTYETTADKALYASDHDLFAFMMMPNVTIEQPIKSQRGDSAPLYKGMIFGNSEVGGGSLWAMRFYMNGVCGNHIIWGAGDVVEVRFRHVGTIRDRMYRMYAECRKWANASTQEESERLAKATSKVIAATKEEVLDTIFGKRSVGLSRKVLEAGYDACQPDVDGDPKTVWGMVQGLTRHSQTVPYADQRNQIDKAAGKIMEIAF